MKMKNRGICITLDIDWLSDDVIDFAADILLKHGVRATWFVTHKCSAVDRLRRHSDLFELGIHPNFMPGSTHGKSTQEVLSHCLEIVPEAVSVRMHGLVQSTSLLGEILDHTPIKVDSSLYLPNHPHLCPVKYVWKGKTLIRVPYYWEDDVEMGLPHPAWQAEEILSRSQGLRVLDFHPLLIHLNASQMAPYLRFREQVRDLRKVTADQLKPFIQSGHGIRNLFVDVLKHVAQTGESRRLKDVLDDQGERGCDD